MTSTEPQQGSQAITRALAVLDCFADRSELTLTQVAGQTGMAVGTTHRILQALVRGGYLRRDQGGTYRVGRQVANLLPPRRVAEQVAPFIYLLAAGIKLTASFGVVNDDELVTLVRARPPVKHCSAQVPAEREPLHATAMGKALMAFDPDGALAVLSRLGPLASYTPRTRITRADLLTDLDHARRYGFAVADGEHAEGVRAVAVPVFGSDGGPVGALGVQARAKRMTDELMQSLVPALRHFSAEVGNRLVGERSIRS